MERTAPYTTAITADSVAVNTPVKIPPRMITGIRSGGMASTAAFIISRGEAWFSLGKPLPFGDEVYHDHQRQPREESRQEPGGK